MSAAKKDSLGSVSVGDAAPLFTLPSQNQEDVSLSDLIAKGVVVLYFYPKDYTLGCTAEACRFRDDYEVFKEAGAEVVGVSADSVKSHQGFAAKHNLPFILLSDKDGDVRSRYGASPTLGILPKRVTFVIDTKGIIRHIFVSQTGATKHVEEALRVVQEIQAESS